MIRATLQMLKRVNMVPFALAQGGKVTKAALYGEILDVLSAKGHKHTRRGISLEGNVESSG